MSNPRLPSTIRDYQLIKPLGKGAHSIVYEVALRLSGEQEHYAMKIIDKNVIKAKQLTEKLINEVQVHKSLSHPRIVSLIHYFEDEQAVYLLTELCQNGELSTYLKTKGKMEEREAHKFIKQIAEGLHYLHNSKVMHRDLKPANIMLTSSFDCKIGDFGLARMLVTMEEERDTLCGTPNYVSPEIVKRVPYTMKTDIWSLGVIVYTLVTGSAPFECCDVPGTLMKVKDADIKMPDYISSDLKELLTSLLTKDPSLRVTVDDIMKYRFMNKTYDVDNKYILCSPLLTRDDSNKENSKYSSNNITPTNSTHARDKQKKESWKFINTDRLQPITHTTSKGYLKIRKDGWVEIEISKKLLCISPNGAKILLKSKLVDCQMEYNHSNFPPKYLAYYKYAYDFVDVLKSKTPKVILSCKDYKCYVMENEPHNIEIAYSSGVKLIYQCSVPLMIVEERPSLKRQFNPNTDYDSLDLQYKRMVDKTLELSELAHQKEIEAASANLKFPIYIDI